MLQMAAPQVQPVVLSNYERGELKLMRVTKLLAVLAMLAFGSGAYATLLTPGAAPAGPISTIALPTGSWLVNPQALSTTITTPGLDGIIYEGVYQENTNNGVGGNAACVGCLDFVYQIKITEGHGMEQVTLFGYAWDGGASDDYARILTSVPSDPVSDGIFHASSGNSSDTPDTADRSVDFDRIHFNFSPGVDSPDYTAIFYVHTNAKTVTQARIQVQDTGQFIAMGYAPAPEPASAGLLLGGLFGAGLMVVRRVQARKNTVA
jgi:hypothetical protein